MIGKVFLIEGIEPADPNRNAAEAAGAETVAARFLSPWPRGTDAPPHPQFHPGAELRLTFTKIKRFLGLSASK